MIHSHKSRLTNETEMNLCQAAFIGFTIKHLPRKQYIFHYNPKQPFPSKEPDTILFRFFIIGNNGISYPIG